MPIEIKELLIKVTVQNSASGAGAAAGGQPESQKKEDIVEECVEKVMDLLRTKYKDR